MLSYRLGMVNSINCGRGWGGWVLNQISAIMIANLTFTKKSN